MIGLIFTLPCDKYLGVMPTSLDNAVQLCCSLRQSNSDLVTIFADEANIDDIFLYSDNGRCSTLSTRAN